MANDDAQAPADRLVSYIPVPVMRHDGALFVENQAIKGLRRWADNFERCDFMTPVEDRPPPDGWSAWTPADAYGRVRLHLLPTAYRPDQFLRALPATLPRIRALVKTPAYRCFAIGGLFGDWGAVSCILSRNNGLDHAVWTDRIESAVTRQGAGEGPLKTRLRKATTAGPMAALERYVIRRANVGLFNGSETYAHYAPMARAAVQVNDLSISREDHIAPDLLATKIAGAAGGPLRIVYVGRADPMKGGPDWCATLALLAQAGVSFQATWFGDGPDLPAMKDAVQSAGIADIVTFPGFTSDRGTVMAALRDAHLLLFCHLTPESPRNLIEALASGTPIIGYDSAYARGLIGDSAGGALCPIGDTDALCGLVQAVANDRDLLARRIKDAAAEGARFDADAIFAHRSKALRDHLRP